ncbi:hypothetical protein LLE87_28835, partial [Paenibacillus polymyxa]|nr:hypothetical protein [Paenibacillus polymyxa]
HDAGFRAVQLEWRWMAGHPYVLARDASADSRIVRRQDGALIVQQDWQPQAVIDAARALFPGAEMQAQVLDLLAAIQQEMGMAVLLITHDLAVVKNVAHHVALMRGGEIVESAS